MSQKSRFSSVTAEAQGRALNAKKKWQSASKKATPHPSITNLVPQILTEAAPGVSVAARRAIFNHARIFLRKNSQDGKMRLIRSVVHGAKAHGHERHTVCSMQEHASEQQERERAKEQAEKALQEEQKAQDTQKEEEDEEEVPTINSTLRSVEFLQQHVSQLQELSMGYQEDTVVHRALATARHCVSVLADLQAAASADVDVLREVNESREKWQVPQQLLQDLQASLVAMRSALQSKPGSSNLEAAFQEFVEGVRLQISELDLGKAAPSAEVPAETSDENGQAEPLEPLEPLEPFEPLEPLEPLEPSEALEPSEPSELSSEPGPLEPRKPSKPLAPLRVPLQPSETLESPSQTGSATSPEPSAGEAPPAVTLSLSETGVRTPEPARPADVGDVDAPRAEASENCMEDTEFDQELAPEVPKQGQPGQSLRRLLNTPGDSGADAHADAGADAGTDAGADAGTQRDASQLHDQMSRCDSVDGFGEDEAGCQVEVAAAAVLAKEECKQAFKEAKASKAAKGKGKRLKDPKPEKSWHLVSPEIKLPPLWPLNRKDTPDLDWKVEDLNNAELDLLNSILDEGNGKSGRSERDVVYDTVKERLWKQVFFEESPKRIPLPPLPKSSVSRSPKSFRSLSKPTPLASLVDLPTRARSRQVFDP
ncbi:unnamed protein product [Effrenium voratum]|nr:unnamed protein product [Effrenium voratum]